METKEEFKIKVPSSDNTGMKWLRRNGGVVVLTKRKALRNFLRNLGVEAANAEVYCNGVKMTEVFPK